MHQSVSVCDHPDSIHTHFYHFLALSRPLQTFPDKNFENFSAQPFPISQVSSMPQPVLVYDHPDSIYSHFYHFLALSRPFQTLPDKNFVKFSSSILSPILGEPNAPIGFCPQPPRLNLYSFLSFFFFAFSRFFCHLSFFHLGFFST
jgi:hypothetical protein